MGSINFPAIRSWKDKYFVEELAWENTDTELTQSHRTSLLPVRRGVAGWSSPLTRRLQAFPGRILLAAGVFEGIVHSGVVAGVCHRELVVELGHVGHDEELVRALTANHVVNIQQLWDPQLPLCHPECQGTVPAEKIKLDERNPGRVSVSFMN